jgi:hypothetical protein
MDTQSQRTAALLAAGGAAVLIVSMFLDWYRLDLPRQVGGREVDIPAYNAFEGLQRADVALVVAAVLAVIIAGLVLAGVLANSPAPGISLVVVCWFALAVVIYRGVSRPTRAFFGGEVDTTLRFGWFLALVAAAFMAVAAVLVYRAGPRLQLEALELDEEDRPGESRSETAARREE